MTMRGTLLVTALTMTACVSMAWAAEEKIKPEELPKAVADAIKGRFPGLEFVSVAKEQENGKVVYDIELTQKGRKFESDVAADGTILEIEKEIAKKDWPKDLAPLIESKHPKATIKEVLEVNVVKDKKEIPDHLEVTLETPDKKEAEILTSLDGKSIHEEADKKEEPAKKP